MAVQAAVSPLAARYGATYRGHPRKAAAALKAARARAQEARQAGDRTLAEEWEEVGDVLESLLGTASRCTICGREIKDPVSIERGIGSDCWKKNR